MKLRSIFTQLFLSLIIFSCATIFSSNTTKAEDLSSTNNNTKFAGFAIEDTIDMAIKNCQESLRYSIDFRQIQSNVFDLTCSPNMDPKSKEYASLIRGKPDQLSILIINSKIVGLHMFFSNKIVYKRIIADFVASDVMPVTPHEKYSVAKYGPLYKNIKENWYGWYYSFLDDDKNKTYVVHVETSQEDD